VQGREVKREENVTLRIPVPAAFSLLVCLLIGSSLTRAQQPAPAKPAADHPKPIKVYILMGQSNMVGFGRINGDGPGTLQTLVHKEGKFKHLADAQGKWIVRDDVFFIDITNRRITQWLKPGVMGRNIGPELQFGFLMGDFHDEQVIVLKAAQGNRSISFDVMPPSSRIGMKKQGKFYSGWQYDAHVKDIRAILGNLKDYFPDYQGQGYEIAGFCWWQGHKDAGLSQRYYERHLVNLINDLRAEFRSPNAKFVVATVGFGGKGMSKTYRQILKAQMAVSDDEKYPEFADNVASFDTRPFWRAAGVSPGGGGHHYNGNAETYMLVGDELGKAMIELIKKETPHDQ
jgi:hypothetical protein